MAQIFALLKTGATALTVSGLYAGVALADNPLYAGKVLNLPGKHIMASNLIGAADGLEEKGVLSADMRERVDGIAAETLPEVRKVLSAIEEAGRKQAIAGEWSSVALETYLDALERPGSDYEGIAKASTVSGEIDIDLICEAVANRMQGSSTPPLLFQAMIEISGLQAAYGLSVEDAAPVVPKSLVGPSILFGLMEEGPLVSGLDHPSEMDL